MERIKTIETRDLCASAINGGCGECQTSCQTPARPAAALPTSSARTKEGLRPGNVKMPPFSAAFLWEPPIG